MEDAEIVMPEITAGKRKRPWQPRVSGYVQISLAT